MKFDPVPYSLLLVVVTVYRLASRWHDVPDSVPVWWNIDGHPTYYQPRWFGFTLLFFFLPVLMVVTTCILQFRSCQLQLSDEYAVGQLIGAQTQFLFFLSAILRDAYVSQSGDISLSYLVANVAFTLMIWPGIFFPYIPPNPNIGILTPWTLDSRHSWTKTHTHAAWVLEINGFALLICALYVSTGVPLLLLTLILGLGSYLYLFIYSLIVYECGESSRESQSLLW
ncbi:hypothetical protein R1sor_003716 [Riccia sorocarpa]|uniref:DUF1648 domain-containing protein n=1 Tax=Riccia sorocarpa TaxID=122646 RepID=A0ABD3H596_9MARC